MAYSLTLIYVSLYYLRPFEWSPYFRGYPVLPIVGGVGFLFMMFSKIREAGHWFENGTDLMMIGFMFSIALSHISHFWFGGAWDSMWRFLPVFVGYFLVTHTLGSEKKLEGFITVLILCTTTIAIIGIIQYHLNGSVGGVDVLVQREQDNYGRVLAEYRRIRWLGPFNDPNDLALALVLVIPFLLHRLMNNKFVFPVLFLPVILYAIYLTNSRGGVLSLVVSILTFFVIRKGKWKGALFAFVGIFLIILFGPNRIGGVPAVDASAHGRLDAWYQGYQILKANPIFGAGAGSFSDFNLLTAHNSLVLVFAELGLVGAFFFLGLFYFPLEGSFGFLLRNRVLMEEYYFDSSIYSAMVASLSGILTSMFFLSRSYTLLPYMVVGMIMACLIETNKSVLLLKPKNNSIYSRHFGKILRIEITIMLIIYIILKVLL